MEGKNDHKRFWVRFLPYVRSEDPTLEIWCKPVPRTEDKPVHVRVGVETLDILEHVRTSDIVLSVTDFEKFHHLKFRVADHWPDWKDKGINMVWLDFSSEEPGFSVALDDVYVH